MRIQIRDLVSPGSGMEKIGSGISLIQNTANEVLKIVA
jgi:hypothetical protein